MMSKRPRLGRLGVLAPAALSVCIDASVLAAPAAGAVLSTVLRELNKAFMLKKWFHGVMSSQEADHLLMETGRSGSYLVRESQTHPGEYVLSVRVRNRVSHVMIRREHNKYDVGSGEVFDDLSGLIEHCRRYPLTETSGDVLRLVQPVNGARARVSSMSLPAEEIVQQEENVVAENVYESPPFAAIEDVISHGFYGDFLGGSRDEEFRVLKQVDRFTRFTTNEGNLPQNINKNRYGNVLPYDQTRVILPYNFYSSDQSDYINANYIKSKELLNQAINEEIELVAISNAGRGHVQSVNIPFKPFESTPLLHAKSSYGAPIQIVKNKFYIAAQGCLKNTKVDFWHMIITKDIRVIAMVTNIVEYGVKKCSQYWPQPNEKERYGDIIVCNKRQYYYAAYIIREFEVTTVDGKQRTIYQFHFNGWFDNAAPSDTKEIFKFLNEINSRMLAIENADDAPKDNILCVHCSAGIGRTGTLIALDMLIDKIKMEGLSVHIDIFNMVKLCRMQRAGMVHTRRQYKFLYLATKEYLFSAEAMAADHYGTTEHSTTT